MISNKLQNAINDQIIAEMWSSNLYLSMSFYLAHEGYDGFAKWLKIQSQEELGHAYDMADFITKRGGVAKVDKIDVVPQGWGTVEEVFKNVYEHECKVSSLINDLVDVATKEDDKAAQYFFWNYVREQIEEEATTLNIYEKIKKVGGEHGLMMLDEKLGQRSAK